MCFLTSQMTEIAKYACEPRLQGLPAEDALAKQYLEQKSFGDLMTADHKVLNELNFETITVTRWWCKILPLNGFNLFGAKPKLLRRRKGVYESFSSRSKSRKVIFLIWQILRRFIMQSPNFDTSSIRDTNGIAERAVRRIKEGTSAVLLQSGLDEKWRADSMECCCCLRNVQMGKLLMNGDSENQLKAQ